MANVDPSIQQWLALAPMVLPILGIPEAKRGVILDALQNPDMLSGGQPNPVVLMDLHSKLQEIDATCVQGRVMCPKCAYLITVRG